MFRIIALFVCFSSILAAEENPSVNYISQYKEIAIAEMERSGIPASIKMAQALLESGAGRSTLATEANNHFGIKCGGEWSGKTFFRKDDDYNHKGELIKSCFRKFKSVDDSFVAHSEFLTTQNRYAFLFNYPSNDYQNWAYGLKEAGYATDSAYPKKLISLIEKYELYLLDQGGSMILADNNPKKPASKNSSHAKQNKQAQNKRSSHIASAKDKKTYQSKESSTVVTYENSSSQRDSKSKKNRRSSNKSSLIYHIVKDNETIAEIARAHGIKESALRLRNRIPKNAEILSGEKIYLRKKIRLLDRPQYSTDIASNSKNSNNKFIF